MMNLFNYAPFWRGERTKRASLCTRWSVEEAKGDEICKASILTGDHGVVSVRNRKIEAQDCRREMIQGPKRKYRSQLHFNVFSIPVLYE